MGSTATTLSAESAALLVCYTLYGLLQEKIMTRDYGGHLFRSSVALVACNRVAGILYATSRQTSCGRTLRPRWPIYTYAAVSAFNFASTLCQYEALKHVSFTTQTLGKCSKMVPVLLIGMIVYRKKYTRDNFIAAALITLGISTYLWSTPARASDGSPSTIRGLCLMIGYLLFDAMASTTEERMFKGRSPEVEQYSRDEMVYDQMLWINTCSLVISLMVMLLDRKNTLSSFATIISSAHGPGLAVDIFLLSASATIGLAFLLSIIAEHGALTSSTLMTGRQFVSIVLNGLSFGSAASVPLSGWIGICYVASGVILELRNKHHRKQTTVFYHAEGQAGVGLAKFVALPVIAGTAVRLLIHIVSGHRDASYLLWTSPASFIYGGQRYTTSEVQLRGSAVACAAPPERTFYPKASPRTALASFPRSGNTFTRELFEHSTGYFTSDVECGSVVMPAYFLPGCDQPSDLLVKTHSPTMYDFGIDNTTWLRETESFDRVVYVVRNPLDAFWSFWHLIRAKHNHLSRQEGVETLSIHHLYEVDRMAANWNQHIEYWMNVQIPRVVIRYEDLRGEGQVQQLAGVLEFVFDNSTELPRIEELMCADDNRSVAYKSKKNALFYGWERFEPEVRDHLLGAVRSNWCKFGYEALFRQIRGHKAVEC